MMLLEQLAQTDASRILGWTLLHSLWQGLVVAAGLAIALQFLRDSRARYAAACVAMAVLAGSVIVTCSGPAPAGSPYLGRSGAGLPPAALPDSAGSTGMAGGYGLEGHLGWLAPLWAAGAMCFCADHSGSDDGTDRGTGGTLQSTLPSSYCLSGCHRLA